MVNMLSDENEKRIFRKKISDVNLNLDYIERFIPKKEADDFLLTFEKEFKYLTGELSRVKVFGKWHQIPRKHVAYGDEGLSYKFSGNVIPASPWPDSLIRLRDKLTKFCGYHYNFVLVNRYNDGSDCMGEHKDDESELDLDVPIASLSFGQTRDFVFRWPQKRQNVNGHKFKSHSVPLKHGDLLFMNNPTNKYWSHSVPRRKNIPGTRISLTFRKILAENMRKHPACEITDPFISKKKA